jgi:hypothetical protein
MAIFGAVSLLILGAFIGAGVSWWFSKSASEELAAIGDELKKETAILRRLHPITLAALEEDGRVSLNRDEGDNVTGRILTMGADGTLQLSGKLTTELMRKHSDAPSRSNAEHSAS